MSYLKFIFLVIFSVSFNYVVKAYTEAGNEIYENLHESCQDWANIGECDKNPNYMLYNCAKSCSEDIPKSFYDLSQKDIDGNLIEFSQFKGKVLYIVNVASKCGYTESNYAQFKELASLRDKQFEIIIFPCDQFGSQEPGDGDEIKGFATQKGFEGIIMEKGGVEGTFSYEFNK
jgi:hypothetical protein